MNRSSEYTGETRPPASTSWRMLADTATVGGWTAAVKVAGAVKVILAARLFGAGDAMDAFLIAFLLPAFFMDMLAGPLDSALIPALIELRQKQGKAAAEALYSNVLAAAGAGFVIAALVAAALSGFILPLLAPSFGPEKLELTERSLAGDDRSSALEQLVGNLACRTELRTSIRVLRRGTPHHPDRFHRGASRRREAIWRDGARGRDPGRWNA